jgi:prepilin-type processing-associated H-X9-DG protein
MPRRPYRPARPSRRRAGAFTLVELLVVIGIIALLISILLPALSKARKSALTIKCASALRQIGMGFQLYGNEQKGWWPVAKYTPDTTYDLEGFAYDSAHPIYWFNFVAKYVNQAAVGAAIQNGVEADAAHKGVLWGCPAWQKYVDVPSELQPGYGMNGWPTFTVDFPSSGVAFPPVVNNVVDNVIVAAGTTGTGHFFRQTQWTNAAERCLVADSRFWLSEADKVPAALSYPPAVVPQSDIRNANTYTPGIVGQTLIDIYRHGSYPSDQPNQTFDPNGGSIAFNILYCDGHVTTSHEAKAAYLALRQHFPN